LGKFYVGKEVNKQTLVYLVGEAGIFEWHDE